MRIPVEWLINVYQANLFVAAFNICKNAEDAKDVVQDTFIAYHTSNQQFHDEQHIRSWLFRVAVNKAKDVNKSFWRRNKMPLEDYVEQLLNETGKEGIIIGADCTVPSDIDIDRLHWVREKAASL